jgi:hypothetical protein
MFSICLLLFYDNISYSYWAPLPLPFYLILYLSLQRSNNLEVSKFYSTIVNINIVMTISGWSTVLPVRTRLRSSPRLGPDFSAAFERVDFGWNKTVSTIRSLRRGAASKCGATGSLTGTSPSRPSTSQTR